MAKIEKRGFPKNYIERLKHFSTFIIRVNPILSPVSNVSINLGWGRTSGGGPAADILQQAQLPLVSHDKCKEKYGIVDSTVHLCAGAGHAAASGGCNGDSGGPLVCEMAGKWYLHGAVSFGKQNCPTTHYTVFTRITSYRFWIMEKIGLYFEYWINSL